MSHLNLHKKSAVVGLVAATIVNMGGASIALSSMTNEPGQLVGNAFSGAGKQFLFNFGLAAGITLATLLCCLPFSRRLGTTINPDEKGPRTSFAAIYYPVAAAATLASLILNLSIQNSPDTRLALNMLAPLIIAAIAATSVVGYHYVKGGCKPFDDEGSSNSAAPYAAL